MACRAGGPASPRSGGGRRARICCSSRRVSRRLNGRVAADHLVQQHADRPEIGVRIDVAGIETFGREIRDAAEVVARDFSAERQRLRDPEVEHLDLIAGRGMRMLRGLRSPCSSDRSGRPSIVGFEGVRRLEEAAQLDPNPELARPAAVRARSPPTGSRPSRYSIAT